MKAYMLYHPNSEHGRMAEDYVREFAQSKGLNIDLMSIDTIEGAQLAKLYGVLAYPAIIVAHENGEMVNFWQTFPLPSMAEVAANML